MSTGAYLSLLQFLHEMPYMSFSHCHLVAKFRDKERYLSQIYPLKLVVTSFKWKVLKRKKRPSQIYFETTTSLSSDIGLLDLAGFYWNIFYNVSLLSFI